MLQMVRELMETEEYRNYQSIVRATASQGMKTSLSIVARRYRRQKTRFTLYALDVLPVLCDHLHQEVPIAGLKMSQQEAEDCPRAIVA